MAKKEKIFVSYAMRVVGGAALQIARSDLFDLLSEQSAQEIAVEVYAAMAKVAPEFQLPAQAEAHSSKERLNRLPSTAKTSRV
jgi:hypothetical protein